VVALFSWVVLHVPINATILIITIKVFQNMSKPVWHDFRLSNQSLVKATSMATHKYNNPGLIKEVQKKLGTSLVWDPSYLRHMHAYKVNVCIYKVIRTGV
jgi:hypothetical protein